VKQGWSNNVRRGEKGWKGIGNHPTRGAPNFYWWLRLRLCRQRKDCNTTNFDLALVPCLHFCFSFNLIDENSKKIVIFVIVVVDKKTPKGPASTPCFSSMIPLMIMSLSMCRCMWRWRARKNSTAWSSWWEVPGRPVPASAFISSENCQLSRLVSLFSLQTLRRPWCVTRHAPFLMNRLRTCRAAVPCWGRGV